VYQIKKRVEVVYQCREQDEVVKNLLDRYCVIIASTLQHCKHVLSLVANTALFHSVGPPSRISCEFKPPCALYISVV